MNAISESYEESYFEQRLAKLGITAQENRIEVWQSGAVGQGNVLKPVPVFRESKKGIDILVYTLARELIVFKPDGSRWSDDYCLTRLKDPIVDKNGNVRKYNIPKGQGTYPFFHPSLIEAFEQQKHIPVLYLTEGFFKAWKGCMHGIPVIGLSSITHMKDAKTGAIHPDIEKLIKYCSVKKIVWLTDGDCLDITSKELDDKKDLYRRPFGFFSSAQTFKTLLDHIDIELWFMHINTDGILEKTVSPPEGGGLGGIKREDVKGLDDLLCTLPNRIDDIVQDIQAFHKNQEYFVKFNISTGTGKLYRHFNLLSVNDFYLFHAERRKDLKDKQFKFNGTIYRFDEEKNQCVIVLPAEANHYCRVGDQYYEFVMVPNKYKQLEKRLETRQRSTIIEDHGKEFVRHVAKYKTFCNVPSHINFQPVVNGCFNVYSPFEHEPDEEERTAEDCPYIMGFLKHIFGQNEISFTHPMKKTKHKYSNLDLGIDYIQLLLQQPERKLPILCLVSKENNTGKSTFANFLKLIFTGNVAIVGNQDLSSDFNRHWATKLVVVCDEAKIDKQLVVEKVKSLSTAEKIMMNSKGKDHVELECFIKFIFITNNEDNFINLTEEDIRFWILKVPRISSEVTDIVSRMQEEIPAFLSFLSRRKLVSESLNRMWFHPELLKTDALKRVQQNSQTVIEKEIRQYFRDIFRDFGYREILMTRRAVHEDALRGRWEANYVEKALLELKVEPYHVFQYNGQNHSTWEDAVNAVYVAQGPAEELELLRLISKKYVTKRHDYPRWETRANGNVTERVPVHIKENGRPYVFKREMFLTQDEIDALEVDPELKQFIDDPVKPVKSSNEHPQIQVDELPF